MTDEELYELELFEETTEDEETAEYEETEENEAKLLEEDSNEIDTKAQVKEIEQETEQNKKKDSEMDDLVAGSSNTLSSSLEQRQEADMRSVYVGNVDYGASAEELESHFIDCGTIYRVTIMCNKADDHPKGFAYIEFASKDSAETALNMNETLFRGRQIKVMPKRTNYPGLSSPHCSFRNHTPLYRGYHFTNRHGSRRRSMGYRGRVNYYYPY